MNAVVVDGHTLTLADVEAVARGVRPVRLADEAVAAMARSRAFIESLLASGETIYGVTTGFGRLADVRISPAEQAELQRNLVRSHAAGAGEPLADEVVRAIMLLRANALARGHSGCRPEVVELLIACLEQGIHPLVPRAGSVGASGDLAPLAHVALALIGEGRVRVDGRVQPAGEALRAAGLTPLTLEAKEGLALINGTQATTALGVLAFRRAERALATADVAGLLSLEGLLGTPEAFRSEVHATRPHPGQRLTGGRLCALIEGSEIRESHRHGDPRVQDAYGLRCMPQVHGAARNALGYVGDVLRTEVNATTDNPLVFPDEEAVVSAGNFHAQVVSAALDFLCIALADVGAICERRIERLLNPDLSGLPAFLTPEPGLRSGFMIAQVTAVDLLAELRVLAHPASVDSVPTSANQEDHVSMGLAAARKAWAAVEAFETIVAIEVLAAAQAVEYRRPLRSSAPLERVLAAVREQVPPLDEDRALSDDIEQVTRLVRAGALACEEFDGGAEGA